MKADTSKLSSDGVPESTLFPGRYLLSIVLSAPAPETVVRPALTMMGWTDLIGIRSQEGRKRGSAWPHWSFFATNTGPLVLRSTDHLQWEPPPRRLTVDIISETLPVTVPIRDMIEGVRYECVLIGLAQAGTSDTERGAAIEKWCGRKPDLALSLGVPQETNGAAKGLERILTSFVWSQPSGPCGLEEPYAIVHIAELEAP